MARQPTKTDLIKEVAALKALLQNEQTRDDSRRAELSDILDNVEIEPGSYGPRSRRVITASWVRIAFLIGELKSDANYSIMLEKMRGLERELSYARHELDKVKREKKENPDQSD